MKLPNYTPGEYPKPTTPWLDKFSQNWHAAKSPSEKDALKSLLISKVSAVRDDWFELIEAAKIVMQSEKSK